MHKRIWFKIHLIIGVFAGIFIMLVSVSGAILSYEKEIMGMLNKNTYIVKVPENKEKLSTKALLEDFQFKVPNLKIISFSFSNDLNSSYVITTEPTKEYFRGKKNYVDPYTGEILPEVKGDKFFNFVTSFHRWFTFSGDYRPVGKHIVAISTIFLIILSITGLVIYWPRVKRSFLKSLTFSFRHNGRAFLSTMHSSLGMWVLIFYLLASLTGLFWSYSWYRSMLYKIANVEQPVKNKAKETRTLDSNNKVNFDTHQKAVELFNEHVKQPYSISTVTFPKSGFVYTFSYLYKDATHFREANIIEIDIKNNKILKNEKFKDLKLNQRLMKSILPLHTGEYFGFIGKTLMFIACLFMILFTVTGYMLYISRNKKKSKIKHH